ncbi:MAG: SocA family protein [Nitrospirae bacterium]|nr:SocA family protein [Nitrospirota bacterium]MBF0535531.1 SocA family protein [Nitrospirota bacterium]MBF0617442.1 SocA family protein [Nitrospirota bacterium]
MTNTTTVIEAVFYLLSKLGPSDKLKLIKLIYLADKFHLIRYGRTVTRDKYLAMEHGPVGSVVKDVLSFNSKSLSASELRCACALFEETDTYTFKAKQSATERDFDMLSESDIESFDFVINQFGRMTQWELRDYTHKYPEWYQHEQLLKAGQSRSEPINTKELLSLLDNDPLTMPMEHLTESGKILTGNYD